MKKIVFPEKTGIICDKVVENTSGKKLFLLFIYQSQFFICEGSEQKAKFVLV